VKERHILITVKQVRGAAGGYEICLRAVCWNPALYQVGNRSQSVYTVSSREECVAFEVAV
jgi:hypothetical protein